MKTEQNTSYQFINCSYCKALLPATANFCTACGKQVKQKQNHLHEADTEYSEQLGEQEGETIHLASLPQISRSRWLLYQSLKNKNHPNQSQASIPSKQDSESVPTQPISSLKERAPSDETVLLDAPIQIEQKQTSPTFPTLSLSKESELTSNLSNVLWPTIIILSAIAVGLVTFVFTDTVIRPIIVFWFVSICPGMIVVRFLHLKEAVVKWALAIALSFAIDATVAGIQLYAGKWSPVGTLTILMILCICGAIVQLATEYSFTHLLLKVTENRLNKVFHTVGIALKLYLVNPLYKGLSKIKDLGNKRVL